MRMVADSNFLKDAELAAFLKRSSQHQVVLSDFLAIEAFKGDTLASIYPSMEILSRFPNQILVLKTTEQIIKLNGRSAGLQKRLLDMRQSREFGEFCRRLALAKKGDVALQRDLLRKGKLASDFISTADKALVDFGTAMLELADTYTPHERKIIRRAGGWIPEIDKKFTTNVFGTALLMFGDMPSTRFLPSYPDAVNTFIFRRCLCAQVWILGWICDGCPSLKSERILNDHVDLSFAAYALFFDGLLTRDKRLIRTYQTSKLLLENLYAQKTVKR